MYLYRGRRFDQAFSKAGGVTRADLIYPPADKAPVGRANRPSDPLFYCTVGKEPVFFELGDLSAGTDLVLAFWRTTARMIVNAIGYTQSAFDALGAKRPCPTWSPEKPGELGSPAVVAAP